MPRPSKFDSPSQRFNSALWYGFNHEQSTRKDLLPVETLLHGFAQITDVLQAYRHADTILADIETQGFDVITPDNILRWCNEIHARIGNAMADDMAKAAADDIANGLAVDADVPVAAGTYTPEQLARWHAGSDFATQFHFHLMLGVPSLDEIVVLGNEANITAADIKAFISLVCKLGNLNDPTAASYEDAVVPGFPRAPQSGILRINDFYNQNRLTATEKAIVDKIIIVCPPPEAIPGKMREFATELAQACRQCDRDNLDEVSALIAKAFLGLYRIHPYINGNRRVATCVANLIAVSLGYPSFLMRDPDSDPSRAENQFTREQDSEPKLLAQRIKAWILREMATPFVDPPKKDYIEAMGRALELVEALFKFKSKPVMDKLYGDFLNRAQRSVQVPTEDRRVYQQAFLTFLPAFTQNLEQMLISFEAPVKAVVPHCVVRTYSESEKTKIASHLAQLTGKSAWKCYNSSKDGLIVRLELATDDEASAESLSQRLKDTGLMQTLVSRLAATTANPTPAKVIQLSKINVDALLRLVALPGNDPHVSGQRLFDRPTGLPS